jgi:hypothetical protein
MMARQTLTPEFAFQKGDFFLLFERMQRTKIIYLLLRMVWCLRFDTHDLGYW